jgi:hypothetical protein
MLHFFGLSVAAIFGYECIGVSNEDCRWICESVSIVENTRTLSMETL